MSADPYRYFRVEAHDLLTELKSGVLALGRGDETRAAVKRVLRAAHTMKSAARVVKLRELGDRVHALEDLLAPYREQAEALAPELLRPVAEHLAAIERDLALIDVRTATDTPLAASPAPASDERVRIVRAEVEEIDELVEGLGAVQLELAALTRCTQESARLRQLAELLLGQLSSRGAELGQARAGTRSLAEDLRGALAALERNIGGGLERVTRELGQARDAGERLRLVPASVLLETLERTAYDAAQALGRSIVFQASGGDVRLDAHVLGLAQRALVQTVRNAVAHGIETEAERRSAGKSPAGLVAIDVARRANRVVLVCRDDGRGVDVEAVRRAAERKGARASGSQSAADLLGALLGGGLSTAGEVNAIAGRGVGMDVVRSAAEGLGADVRVRTSPGHGTEIELSVPLLLSSLDVLLVRSEDETFAFALDAIRGTKRVAPDDVVATAESEAIVDGARAIPFAPLWRCLGVATPRSSPQLTSAVLVRAAGRDAAIGVERLLGVAHVILRPLPELAPSDGTVAGVALDAAGEVVLVLDAERVAARAARSPRVATPIERPAPVLVVDDSLTTRMLEQSILESAGYEVELAVSGEDALAKLARATYSLVLVDVEMPGIDGFEVIRRIRSEASTRELPAILVTSRDAAADRALGRQVGATDYVVKGEFDQTLLLGRIRELVS